MIDATRPRGRPNDDAEVERGRAELPLELWGALVFEARRHHRMSQCALAEAAGVTQQTISKVETGDICAHDRLKVRLAAGLQVPIAELFPWPSDTGSRTGDDR